MAEGPSGRGAGNSLIGTDIGGCRIEVVIGRGGMGVVYLAEQVGLQRKVAVKVIAPELARDTLFAARFQREARLAASLNHPNVVTVYGAGDHDGLLYLVMQYVPGTNLRDLIAREGALAPARAARLVAQIGSALDAVHAAGQVHRDVKSANILIGRDSGNEVAYLTDFGLTRVRGEGAVTRTGQWAGTLDYTAPEQFQGGDPGPRSDVYSLGCVLFQALTGSAPFKRDSDTETMWAHVNDEPPRASAATGVPAELDGVIARALAKDPARRYASAGALGKASLGATAAGDTVPVPDDELVTLRGPTRSGVLAGATRSGVLPEATRSRAVAGATRSQILLPPEPPPPRSEVRQAKRFPVLPVALGAATLLAATAILLLATGVFSGSHKSPTDKAAVRAAQLTNDTAGLTHKISALADQMAGNPSATTRAHVLQELPALHRQARSLEKRSRKELKGPAGKDPHLSTANSATGNINNNIGKIIVYLGTAADHPGTPIATAALKKAGGAAKSNELAAAQVKDQLYKYSKSHPSLVPILAKLFPHPPAKPSIMAPVWTKASGPSPPVGSADAVAVAYDGASQRVILFRESLKSPGADCAGYSAQQQTWAWSGSSWTLVTSESGSATNASGPTFLPKLPGGPGGAESGLMGMAYDGARKELVLVGAACQGVQTWTFDGDAWTLQHPAHTPKDGAHPSMAYDPARRRIVFFGGPSAGAARNDTWTWNGRDWTLEHPAHQPPGGRYAGMATDPGSPSVVLSGGEREGFLYAWRWRGTDWRRELTPEPRPELGNYSFVADTERRIPLLVGLASTGTWQQLTLGPGDAWTPLRSRANPRLGKAYVAYDEATSALVAVGPGTTWVGTELGAPAANVRRVGPAGPSQAGFVFKANRACKQANQQVQALPSPTDLPTLSSTASREASIAKAQATQLEGITPPAANRSGYRKLVDRFRMNADLLSQVQAAADAGDTNSANSAIRKLNDKLLPEGARIAGGLGLNDCASSTQPQG